MSDQSSSGGGVPEPGQIATQQDFGRDFAGLPLIAR
jgi:hypothetical protein